MAQLYLMVFRAGFLLLIRRLRRRSPLQTSGPFIPYQQTSSRPSKKKLAYLFIQELQICSTFVLDITFNFITLITPFAIAFPCLLVVIVLIIIVR